jgi:hypothetical protein
LLARNFSRKTVIRSEKEAGNEKRGHFNRGKEGDILKEL